ncbi:nucleotide exchange factor GrpE [Paenibacillaceae bacterium]|nr:nucleotide exchange factor GrpE [Paenibacillaceae bacterium]
MSEQNQSVEEQTKETNDNLDEQREVSADSDIQEEIGNVESAENEGDDTASAPRQALEDTLHAELKKQAEDNYQRYLRTQADFDNFRRRSIKEREELAQYASLKLVEQLLPVVDNFERALSASKGTGEIESYSKGVDMIFRQLSQILEQEGLKPMDTVGQPFNPDFHQAIMQVESDDYEEGIVVEEVQKGFMLKDKVLRPAMVKVSS